MAMDATKATQTVASLKWRPHAIRLSLRINNKKLSDPRVCEKHAAHHGAAPLIPSPHVITLEGAQLGQKHSGVCHAGGALVLRQEQSTPRKPDVGHGAMPAGSHAKLKINIALWEGGEGGEE